MHSTCSRIARAVGEVQRHVAFRRLAGSKLMASRETTASFLLEVDALQLGAEHPLEAQRRAPAHVLLRAALAAGERVGPVEAVADGGKPPLARQIGDVADLQHGILQVRRHHRQVVGIEARSA